MAPPDGRPVEYNIDINLSRLGRRAGRFVNMPPEYSLRLAALYRELANREASLGPLRRVNLPNDSHLRKNGLAVRLAVALRTWRPEGSGEGLSAGS